MFNMHSLCTGWAEIAPRMSMFQGLISLDYTVLMLQLQTMMRRVMLLQLVTPITGLNQGGMRKEEASSLSSTVP